MARTPVMGGRMMRTQASTSRASVSVLRSPGAQTITDRTLIIGSAEGRVWYEQTFSMTPPGGGIEHKDPHPHPPQLRGRGGRARGIPTQNFDGNRPYRRSLGR